MSTSKLEVKIYYEDTDAGGVVYYANYLRYLERARTEWLRENGVIVKELIKRGVHFIVVHTEIEFKSSGVYGDILEVESYIKNLTKITLEFEHKIREKESQRLVVWATTKLACINDDNKIIRIPADIMTKINAGYSA